MLSSVATAFTGARVRTGVPVRVEVEGPEARLTVGDGRLPKTFYAELLTLVAALLGDEPYLQARATAEALVLVLALVP